MENPRTSLNLLLFSIGGVAFGADADQIAGTAPFEGKMADDAVWFHEELGFGANNAIRYGNPTIITIRTGNNQNYKVIIDALEDIAETSSVDIHPFPPLVEPMTLNAGLWGIVLRDGHMIFLVDFLRLLKGKMRRNFPSGGC